MQIIVEVLGKTVCFQSEQAVSTVEDVKAFVCDSQHVLPAYQVLTCHGRRLEDDALIDKCCDLIRVNFRLCGGKGGFGSLLRAQGNKRSGAETDNIDAMRDLSGRRIRLKNNEKQITEWLAAQRELEEDSLKRKQEKLERKLAVPKHVYDHHSLEIKLNEQKESVKDAVKMGLQAAAQAAAAALKPKLPEDRVENQKKKPCLRDDWEDEISSDSESESASGVASSQAQSAAASADGSASGEGEGSASSSPVELKSAAATSASLPTTIKAV